MVVYTDFIGSGTGSSTGIGRVADYANIGMWYGASGDGAVVFDNGDEVRAILQTSVENHDGYHDFDIDQTSPICWTEDKDIIITFSSTHPTGSGTPDGWLRVATGAEIENASSSKVWNFKDLDIVWNNFGGIKVNYDLTADASSSRTVLNFDRCKLVSPSSTGANNMFSVGSNVAAISGIHEFNFTNCYISPDRKIVNTANGFETNTNYVICNVVGCSILGGDVNGSVQSWFAPSTRSTANYELHVSGSLFHYFPTTPGQYAGVVENPHTGAGWTSGTAVDYITNEPQVVVEAWADTRTNVSSAATFVYGVAPGANEVGFAGATIGNNPFDFYTRDSRLWESTNNIASGFVSNVTLPSPDLAGNSRGTSPFDAGAFEIVSVAADPGGGGGATNTSPTFKMVQVNLYN